MRGDRPSSRSARNAPILRASVGSTDGSKGNRPLIGQVLLVGEEPDERPALLRDGVADRPARHGLAGLDHVEDGALRSPTLDFELFKAKHRAGAPYSREL
jgi:hypothetical protein